MQHPRRIEARRGAASTVSSLAAVLVLGALGLGCVDASTEHRVRANAFLRGGDAASALKEIDLGLDRKQDDPGLLILRGKALFELDRMADARDAYARAMASGKATGESDRTLAEAHLGLAMVGSRTEGLARGARELRGAGRHQRERRDVAPQRGAGVHRAARLRVRGLPRRARGSAARKRRVGALHARERVPERRQAQGSRADVPAHLRGRAGGVVVPVRGQALVAAKSGDNPRALAQLSEAVSRKVPNPGSIATEPVFAPLRNDPVFVELVNKATAAKD